MRSNGRSTLYEFTSQPACGLISLSASAYSCAQEISSRCCGLWFCTNLEGKRYTLKRKRVQNSFFMIHNKHSITSSQMSASLRRRCSQIENSLAITTNRDVWNLSETYHNEMIIRRVSGQKAWWKISQCDEIIWLHEITKFVPLHIHSFIDSLYVRYPLFSIFRYVYWQMFIAYGQQRHLHSFNSGCIPSSVPI